MSTFTLSLKRAIELTGGTVELEHMSFNGADMGHISKLTGGEIGIGLMPIFDEEYRPIITGKVVDHFWNREIGFETIDLFKMKMRSRLNNIMPFYNQLYKSTLVEYEALSTINLKTESTSRNAGTEESNATSNAENLTKNASRAVQSTTPQTMLSGDEDYASAASDTNSQAESEAQNTSLATAASESESEGDSLVTGYQGTPADLIMRFRDSLINVDLMIIRDLEQMFMQVFDNADSYTERGISHGYY